MKSHDITDRTYWLDLLARIARPVLTALAAGELKQRMPVEAAPNMKDRAHCTHLEAVGRLLVGIAPWLELATDESAGDLTCREMGALARKAMASAVDPASPDCCNFASGSQPLVDAAFLAQAVLRAPRALWHSLDGRVQKLLVEALRSTRIITPAFCNWLLFSATIEALFCAVGEPWDGTRVDYAVRQHEQWYKGDGVYGDGSQFHFDYYNSFVIQPMLLAVLEATAPTGRLNLGTIQENAVKRAVRYAEIQERLIAPDGSYPITGRSIAYRGGAFHCLADMSLRQRLPSTVAPAQVRCALTAVLHRTMDAPGTFDENGWLTIGLAGHQPGLGEGYISTGSTYLCSTALLPLGLPASNPFWADAPIFWTGKRLWAGQDGAADHALHD